MYCLLICSVLITSSFADPISFEPIDDATGLMFEHVASLRHVSDERFLFVKTLDYSPLLHELKSIANFLRDDVRNNATECPLLKLIKPKKPRAIMNRISEDLSLLTQLDATFYNLDYNSMSNEETNDVVFFDYVDHRQQDADYADTYNPPHWSEVSVMDVRALMRSGSTNCGKILDAVSTVNVTDNFLKYIMDGNRTEDNNCMYLNDMYKMINRKLANATAFANTLDKFIKQTRRNKLNNTNNVFDDNALLHEMRQLIRMLNSQNLSWVVDFERIMNAHFDLSQAYKLHLFANGNIVVLCIAMPLMKRVTSTYGLYRIATVPFCRGTICLMMVPSTSHIAIAKTRNYYTTVPDNYRTVCKEFTGYDEFLCPASERFDTLNSGVCEIEMFMGRYAQDIDALCNVRVADNNGKQVLLDMLVNNRKWLYAFARNATVSYVCKDTLQEFATTVSPGVGLVVVQPLQLCSVSVNQGALMFTANTKQYVTSSTSYWPSRRFDYNKYVDASLLSQTSTPFADAVKNLSLTQLRTLRSRFYIRDYTAAPKNTFALRNNVHAPQIVDKNVDLTYSIIIIVLVAGIVGIVSSVGYCVYKRHRNNQKNVPFAVSFKNEDLQPIITIDSDTHNNVHIKVPNNTVHTTSMGMFPMEIKQINNKINQ
ncbi:envelope protein [Condylorrhiza vestigialis mutiple nucleopolyhedrovirus]|uniref:Envelope protein n=1 Tax=Condylorrhiza vestigialis mutiple nucleopolyhedrovirus TaxID=1592576 RepID=A0A0B4UKD4_9ABAC|nr:envelope protein [Condylorrhiza vestigialis mutiple nucleopolyhedrovirus]AJD09285.1 envelope protein [Condylorrhiza vestigialis mutiple nucleopolyhedrovirus]